MTENVEGDEGATPDTPNIILQPEQMAGVWANFASVGHSEHEFTLDFIRMETGNQRGIVVSRVSVSPLFVTQLIEALQLNWAKFAAKAMPREIYDDPAASPDDPAPNE